jgi:ankyrin repeat protein
MVRIFLALFAFVHFASATSAQQNVALVIGNSQYEHVSPLDNPVRDAKSVSSALTKQGFEVTTIIDQTFSQMNSEFRKFRDAADRADIALVYYAGHGIEVAGQNYLIPTDAALQDERDTQVQAINLNAMLQQISGAKKLKLIVLDACRDNPFIAKMKRANAGRSVGRGLSLVETSLPGTLIAYAAAAGETTPDGPSGGNSPFTTAFVETLDGPPVDIRRFFGKVRDNLQERIPHAEPFLYSSLGGDEILIQKPSPLKPSSSASPEVSARNTPDAKISNDFKKAYEINTGPAWSAFIRLHGNSGDNLYLEMAQDFLEKAGDEQVAALTLNENVAALGPDPNKELLRALNEGDESGLVEALKNGADPDVTQQPSNSTPLITAAARGDEAVVEALLAAGADLKKKDMSGNTALHAAVLFNSKATAKKIVRLLLNHQLNVVGKTPNYSADQNNAGTSFLSLLMTLEFSGPSSVQYTHADLQRAFTEIIKRNKLFLSVMDQNGKSPLITAVEAGNVWAVEQMINIGVKLLINGKTATMQDYARSTRNWKFLSKLPNDRTIPAGFKLGASVSDKIQMQRNLKNWGYYSGSLDGAFGPASRSALQEFLDDQLFELKSMEPFTARIDIEGRSSQRNGPDVVEKVTARPKDRENDNCTWKYVEWAQTKRNFSTSFFGCVKGAPNWNSSGFAIVKYFQGNTEYIFLGPKGWDDISPMR